MVKTGCNRAPSIVVTRKDETERLFLLQPRVEDIAQAVAEDVESEHGADDTHPRIDRHPPRTPHELLCLLKHRPPRWDRRSYPEPQETQARYHDDVHPDRRHGDDYERGDRY